MSAARIVVIGFGAGGPDSLTLGALRRLRVARDGAVPIIARTLRHPTVDWLRSEEFAITESFDSLYVQSSISHRSMGRSRRRFWIGRAKREKCCTSFRAIRLWASSPFRF